MKNKYIKFSLLVLTFMVFQFTLSTKVSALAINGKPTKIPSGKMVACKAREVAITTRLNQLESLVVNVEAKFSMIASRVEDYYKNKILPGGKSLPNYAFLAADIQNKKLIVDNTIAVSKGDLKSFSCEVNEPKIALNKFKNDMQAVKSALKNYRTSIKNMIVAVRKIS